MLGKFYLMNFLGILSIRDNQEEVGNFLTEFLVNRIGGIQMMSW